MLAILNDRKNTQENDALSKKIISVISGRVISILF